jgi:hypothetical protein
MLWIYLARQLKFKDMIKWLSKPNGAAPVQAEGWFLGHYFYFRSRYDQAKIQFCRSQHDWDENYITKEYVLYSTKETYGASWLPYWFSVVLIYKGCFKFLLNRVWRKICGIFSTL